VKNAKTLVVIVGPTAVGKTAVAIEVARNLRTEIVSADSRQIFRELTIGTAKPNEFELSQVKHHFINSHSITEDYDAARYGLDALKTIEKIFATNKKVVLVGGSGLYVKAVCEGFDDIPEVSPEVRKELVRGYETFGLDWLQKKIEDLDPDMLEVIDRKNPQRMMRALEVKIGTGKSITAYRTNNKRLHDFKIVKIGLELPREELYRRIDTRMDKMISDGLFEEARQLSPLREKNALQTVGYQEIFDFTDEKYDYDEAVRLLKRNTRRYAKRQLTWFKKDKEITWFSPFEVSAIMKHIETNS
jgi:tRNA dimethylallyltransferase